MPTRARPRALRAARALALLVPLLVTLAPSRSTKTPRATPQNDTAPFPRTGEYAGEAICKDCHEEQHAALLGGVHAAVLGAKDLQACETCHGPGKLHADDKDNATKLITHPPDLGRGVVAFCGRCHADAARAHGGDLAGFLAAGKTCTTCHKVHEKRPAPPPHASTAFHARRDLAAHPGAQAVGAQKCIECHPLRDEVLGRSAHAALSSAHEAGGCESCHGPGSLHVDAKGLARLITRPDRAADGAGTCRSCHADVHPSDFHWHGKHKPLLSPDMTCTTCHTVHTEKKIAAVGLDSGGADVTDAILAAHRPSSSSGGRTGDQPVTNDLCARCHEPAFAVLHDTVHESLGRREAPLAEGCGACHQGAKEHAASGGRKHLVSSLRGSSAKTQAQTCHQCHAHEPALAHHASGAHQRHEVGCLSCHSPAAGRGETRRDAEAKCASCHQAVAAEFLQPHHHPVPEHAMGCSDCHDPHGARSKVRDLELREERCVSCHTQYRGPFVFAHQASRSDGCVACHLPHGAANKRLLRQHTTQQNCLQCHADFPIFHDQTTGAVFTNCLHCHTEVHGSNHSRYLFR